MRLLSIHIYQQVFSLDPHKTLFPPGIGPIRLPFSRVTKLEYEMERCCANACAVFGSNRLAARFVRASVADIQMQHQHKIGNAAFESSVCSTTRWISLHSLPRPERLSTSTLCRLPSSCNNHNRRGVSETSKREGAEQSGKSATGARATSGAGQRTLAPRAPHARTLAHAPPSRLRAAQNELRADECPIPGFFFCLISASDTLCSRMMLG